MNYHLPPNLETGPGPGKTTSGEAEQKWIDAGIMPAVRALPDIAKAINLTDQAFDERWETVKAVLDMQTDAIQRAFLLLATPEMAGLRADISNVYPGIEYIFNHINQWIKAESAAAAKDKTDGSKKLIEDLMAAFTKEGAKLEWAGNFDPENPTSFKNSDAKMDASKEREFGSTARPNSPPPPAQHWECRIGGSKFYVPPLNISVSQGFKVSSLGGAGIRQKGTPKFNSGHSETLLSMTLYFPNQDQIWGIGSKNATNIDFNKDDDQVIDTFMGSLRGLITQFKYAPFLPIKSNYINKAYNITGVIMKSMSVYTVPDYPFCIGVDLNMAGFNHKVYLPGIEDFNNAIHWGRYRQYIGRAAEKMSTEMYRGYLIRDEGDGKSGTDASGAPVTIPEDILEYEESYGSITGSGQSDSDNLNDEEFAQEELRYEFTGRTGFNRKNEIESGRNFALYYPERTPLKVFAPDLTEWRTQGEDDSLSSEKGLWDNLLGIVGVDVDKHPDAVYELQTTSATLPNGDFGPLTAWIDVSKFLQESIDSLKHEDVEKKINKQIELYKKEHNGKISVEVENEIYTQIYRLWLRHLYKNFRDTPYFKKYQDQWDKLNKGTQLKEWDIPMAKFPFDPKSMIINAVNVSLSNTFASLQLQMQDSPTYQHLGSGDSTVEVSMTVIGDESLAKLRILFDHINGLARLEYAHGSIGFLGIKNILANLCDIKYGMPTSYDVQTVEGHPNVYNVNLSFVDFDIFQQRREDLASDQQLELIDAFSKRNPFLRLKQLWGATNCYPDMPLSLRDEKGNITGHLDPDFYFKAFQTIEDSVVNYMPGSEWKAEHPDIINTEDTGANPNPHIFTAERQPGEAITLYKKDANGEIIYGDDGNPIADISKAWVPVTYIYADGSYLIYQADEASAGTYKVVKRFVNPTVQSYQLYDYSGNKTDVTKPGNMPDNSTGNTALSNSGIYGDLSQYDVSTFFPIKADTHGGPTTIVQAPEGVILGHTDGKTGQFIPEAENASPVAMGEERSSKGAIDQSVTEGSTAFAGYTNEYDEEAKTVYEQFELMMKDTQYRNKSGRMLRAFPTYMLWLIDEGGNYAGVKLYDNFYSLSSIVDFSIHQSEDILGDVLTLSVSNLYQKLTRPSEIYASLGAKDNLFKNEDGTGIIDLVFNRARNLDSGTSSDPETVKIGNVRLKPGVRVHMRMGFSANPNALPTVFNGTITEVMDGEIVTITAQSDAIELSSMVNSTNKKGDTGRIDGSMMTNMWMSEPRDLMVSLLTESSSNFKQFTALMTRGTFFSQNKYGIRHFGNILYDCLTEKEQDQHDKTRETVASQMKNFGANLNKDLSLNPDAESSDMGYNTWQSNSGNTAGAGAIIGQMWANLVGGRDYEIFKRNIYPGNGLGVAQFLGGDLLDGGETLAIADIKPNDPRIAGGAKGKDSTETNDGVAVPSAGAIEQADAGAAADGSAKEEKEKDKEDKEDAAKDGGNLLDWAWDLTSEVLTSESWLPMLLMPVTGPGAVPVVSTVYKLRNSPIFEALGLSGEVKDDDLQGFDEISFRAQTYMKTVWDLFKVCANLLPNYIVAVRPFEDRSTVFYGKPHWLYTSGVIPLTTGVNKDVELPPVKSDDTMETMMRDASESARLSAQYKEQYETLSKLAETAYGAQIEALTSDPTDPTGTYNNDWNTFTVEGENIVGNDAVLAWFNSYYKSAKPRLTEGASVADVIAKYLAWGEKLGVRGDMAFVQACNETGGFTNNDTPRNNFAGIGHYDNAAAGLDFTSIEQGVEVHIRLLKQMSSEAASGRQPVIPGGPRWGGRQIRIWNQMGGNFGTGSWATATDYGSALATGWNSLMKIAGEGSFDTNREDPKGDPVDTTGQNAYEEGDTAAEKEAKDKASKELRDADKKAILEQSKRREAAGKIRRDAEDGIFSNGLVPVYRPLDYYGVGHEEAKKISVGYVARLLYDTDFSKQQSQEDPKAAFPVLGDPSISQDGDKTLDEANEIWDDLRYGFYFDRDMFETYIKQHSALYKTEELEALMPEGEGLSVRKVTGGKDGKDDGWVSKIVNAGKDWVGQVVNPVTAGMDLWHAAHRVGTGDTDKRRMDAMQTHYMNWMYVRNDAGQGPTRANKFLGGDAYLEGLYNGFYYLTKQLIKFLWNVPYARAWVVVTADKILDNASIPWPGDNLDIDINWGKDHEYHWTFGRVHKLWEELLDQFDNDTKMHADSDYILNDENLLAWMQENNEPGNEEESQIEKTIQDVKDALSETVGVALQAAAMGITGAINLFRVQLMQLGIGLSMSGSMQRAANVLNSVYNDSIYYSAGDPNGSPSAQLLRLADNPFTREYGEPVVEIREPFQRIHYIDSYHDIIRNTIAETTNNVYTKVTAVSNGEYPVTVHFDKGMPPNMQFETTIETGIYWDNPGGKGIFAALHPLLHPIETARGLAKASTGYSDELLARRIALAHLKESLKDIYSGELWVIGNPDIRPHDLVYMGDLYTRTYGLFEVEAVTHHFTADLGFVTAIVPNAVVTINDPARWSCLTWARSRWSMMNLRNDARALINDQTSELSALALSKNLTPEDLHSSLKVQIENQNQYTHGSSALIKDMAGLDKFGAMEYAKQQIKEETKLTGTTAAVGILGNTFTLGLAGKAWDMVKNNLLDQQGCYIQYLTRDGQAMDAGLSYAQGVAVGRHHSKTILPGILGVKVNTMEDGHRRITSDDLLSQLGWSELDVMSLKQDMNWWVSKFNSDVMKLAGRTPDEITFKSPETHLAVVKRVIDGDTLVLGAWNGASDDVNGATGDAWGGESNTSDSDGRHIRLTGLAAPELVWKDIVAKEGEALEGIFDDFNEVTLNSPNNYARQLQEYLERLLIIKPQAEGRQPVVAVRINTNEPVDFFGRTLGVVFHNPPLNTPNPEVPRVLQQLASKWPIISWDSYMADGRPYTLNWDAINSGYAKTDIGGLNLTYDQEGAN